MASENNIDNLILLFYTSWCAVKSLRQRLWNGVHSIMMALIYKIFKWLHRHKQAISKSLNHLYLAKKDETMHLDSLLHNKIRIKNEILQRVGIESRGIS